MILDEVNRFGGSAWFGYAHQPPLTHLRSPSLIEQSFNARNQKL
jgi:hypothetical protein